MACESPYDFESLPLNLEEPYENQHGLTDSRLSSRAEASLLERLARYVTLHEPNSFGPQTGPRDQQNPLGPSPGQSGESPAKVFTSSASRTAPVASTSNTALGQHQQQNRQDPDNEDDDEARDSDGEGKPSRTRDKNRRAQQRFRQRQKAKLQAKEQEAMHLHRQVQALQAQLMSIQLQGTSPALQHQAEHAQHQCQVLQSENLELRSLALHYLGENSRLRAERSLDGTSNRPEQYGASSFRSLLHQQPVQRHLQNLGPSRKPYDPLPLHSGSILDRAQMPLPLPSSPKSDLLRSFVFKDLGDVPWQVVSDSLGQGLPAGVWPGNSNAIILLKMLNRTNDGSTTVLVKFPPGFVHDYVVHAEDQQEEGIVIAGSLTDTVLNQKFSIGHYSRFSPGVKHGPYRADCSEGAVCFVVTRKIGI